MLLHKIIAPNKRLLFFSAIKARDSTVPLTKTFTSYFLRSKILSTILHKKDEKILSPLFRQLRTQRQWRLQISWPLAAFLPFFATIWPTLFHFHCLKITLNYCRHNVCFPTGKMLTFSFLDRINIVINIHTQGDVFCKRFQVEGMSKGRD